MHKRIAVIKTGWCQDYDGDAVEAAHKNVARYKEGHERYNFRRGPQGGYFGYTPPIGKLEVPPAPKELDGWLVFVLAKKKREPGIYLAGWYEDATFQEDYTPRPEYDARVPQLERDNQGGKFSYILRAPAGHADSGARATLQRAG
jgi:hypothetical protein